MLYASQVFHRFLSTQTLPRLCSRMRESWTICATDTHTDKHTTRKHLTEKEQTGCQEKSKQSASADEAGERPGKLSSCKDRSITTKCSSPTPEGPECARAHPRDLAVRKPDIIVIIHLSLITTEGKARSVCFELLTVSSPNRRLRTWRKQTLPSVSVLRLTDEVFLPRLLFSGRSRVEAGPGVFWQLFYSLRLL